jgi:hypothetical protein
MKANTLRLFKAGKVDGRAINGFGSRVKLTVSDPGSFNLGKSPYRDL